MSVISRDRVKLRNAMFNIHMTIRVIGCSVFSFNCSVPFLRVS